MDMQDNEIWNSEVEESDEISGRNETPFDPREIQIYPKTLVLALLIRRIKSKMLDLHPDFQRNSGVWSKTKQSRLIESLMIRIPLPSFYFDASQENHWLVVDGLQRLSTIYDFVIGKFKLNNLEFLHEFEGLTYDRLPSVFQMRIDEAEVTSYLIMPGTPRRVKFDIFRRINTGGKQLSAQEIRHALNLGVVTDMIKFMAETPEFVEATDGKLSSLRMADRECALRYLAFLTLTPEAYQRKDFDLFLCDFMSDFNEQHQGASIEMGELGEIIGKFRETMAFAKQLLGEYAFRKVRTVGEVPQVINKALFEAWSVNLANLHPFDRDLLLNRRDELLRKFVARLNSDEEFLQSVSQGTGDVLMVRKRFNTIRDLLREVEYD